jgi:antitoxin StbD
MHSKNYISSTTLSKKTSATLDSFDKGAIDTMIILKNNKPRAVLVSMKAYEAMQEEIEDLRLTALTLARAKSFDLEKAATHESMMKKFVK